MPSTRDTAPGATDHHVVPPGAVARLRALALPLYAGGTGLVGLALVAARPGRRPAVGVADGLPAAPGGARGRPRPRRGLADPGLARRRHDLARHDLHDLRGGPGAPRAAVVAPARAHRRRGAGRRPQRPPPDPGALQRRPVRDQPAARPRRLQPAERGPVLRRVPALPGRRPAARPRGRRGVRPGQRLPGRRRGRPGLRAARRRDAARGRQVQARDLRRAGGPRPAGRPRRRRVGAAAPAARGAGGRRPAHHPPRRPARAPVAARPADGPGQPRAVPSPGRAGAGLPGAPTSTWPC